MTEEADSAPLEDGQGLPDEIARREECKASLEKAKKVIEQRYEEGKQQKREEYEEKKQASDEQRKNGKKPRGRDPKPPDDDEPPPDNMKFNFIDEESRIMKAGNNKHFVQAYNAQAAVDTEYSKFILGQYVTSHTNDKLES